MPQTLQPLLKANETEKISNKNSKWKEYIKGHETRPRGLKHSFLCELPIFVGWIIHLQASRLAKETARFIETAARIFRHANAPSARLHRLLSRVNHLLLFGKIHFYWKEETKERHSMNEFRVKPPGNLDVERWCDPAIFLWNAHPGEERNTNNRMPRN